MSTNDIKRVHIITTGGTIEKSYDEVEGTLENREPLFRKEVIDRLRLPYREIIFHPLLAKDSLYMTDEDRQAISHKVQELARTGEPVVVLHGTDTMTLSADKVKTDIGQSPVAIVFTGAMRPIGFENSDAVQNATEALLASLVMPPGVYISFHGRVFTVPAVRKNREKRTFEGV